MHHAINLGYHEWLLNQQNLYLPAKHNLIVYYMSVCLHYNLVGAWPLLFFETQRTPAVAEVK